MSPLIGAVAENDFTEDDRRAQSLLRVEEERELPIAWLERVLNTPQQIEPDPDDAEREHHLGQIAEHGNRVLRVVVNKSVRPARVVTLYFDRTMRHTL